MNIANLTSKNIKSALISDGIKFKIGPFNVCLKSEIPSIVQHLQVLYCYYPILSDNEIIDFHVSLQSPIGLRRWYNPQVSFSFDGYRPFLPLPREQAPAMFEWGLNWCIASYAHQFLILHSAVVERNGCAFVFPGTPGSGKSTLCAALVCRGWRLLSDEMGLISTTNQQFYPVPRPVSLKNESIDVISKFSELAKFGMTSFDTVKGTIVHMLPPEKSVVETEIQAKPSKIIFPTYQSDAKTTLTPLLKSRAFLKLAENSFNYNVIGKKGFLVLSEVIENSECFEFKYSKLNEAMDLMDEISG